MFCNRSYCTIETISSLYLDTSFLTLELDLMSYLVNQQADHFR